MSSRYTHSFDQNQNHTHHHHHNLSINSINSFFEPSTPPSQNLTNHLGNGVSEDSNNIALRAQSLQQQVVKTPQTSATNSSNSSASASTANTSYMHNRSLSFNGSFIKIGSNNVTSGITHNGKSALWDTSNKLNQHLNLPNFALDNNEVLSTPLALPQAPVVPQTPAVAAPPQPTQLASTPGPAPSSHIHYERTKSSTPFQNLPQYTTLDERSLAHNNNNVTHHNQQQQQQLQNQQQQQQNQQQQLQTPKHHTLPKNSVIAGDKELSTTKNKDNLFKAHYNGSDATLNGSLKLAGVSSDVNSLSSASTPPPASLSNKVFNTLDLHLDSHLDSHTQPHASLFTAAQKIDKDYLISIGKVPLNQLKPQILKLAKDQYGCRFLQKKIDENLILNYQARLNNFTIIFDEIHSHMYELIIDPFGNYLVQKMIAYCNQSNLDMILDTLQFNLFKISVNQHGTRALQKIIDSLSTSAQLNVLIRGLKPHIIDLIKDLNGNHVIQKILNKYEPADCQFIYDSIIEDLYIVATHKHGCCVLQKCLNHVTPAQLNQFSLAILQYDNFKVLINDQFGNYVLQYLISINSLEVSFQVLQNFHQYGIMNLCNSKFSSNVVEKYLKNCYNNESVNVAFANLKFDLIYRILIDDLNTLINDPFGNYVIQTLIDFLVNPRVNYDNVEKLAILLNNDAAKEDYLACHNLQVAIIKSWFQNCKIVSSFGKRIQSKINTILNNDAISLKPMNFNGNGSGNNHNSHNNHGNHSTTNGNLKSNSNRRASQMNANGEFVENGSSFVKQSKPHTQPHYQQQTQHVLNNPYHAQTNSQGRYSSMDRSRRQGQATQNFQSIPYRNSLSHLDIRNGGGFLEYGFPARNAADFSNPLLMGNVLSRGPSMKLVAATNTNGSSNSYNNNTDNKNNNNQFNSTTPTNNNNNNNNIRYDENSFYQQAASNMKRFSVPTAKVAPDLSRSGSTNSPNQSNDFNAGGDDFHRMGNYEVSRNGSVSSLNFNSHLASNNGTTTANYKHSNTGTANVPYTTQHSASFQPNPNGTFTPQHLHQSSISSVHQQVYPQGEDKTGDLFNNNNNRINTSFNSAHNTNWPIQTLPLPHQPQNHQQQQQQQQPYEAAVVPPQSHLKVAQPQNYSHSPVYHTHSPSWSPMTSSVQEKSVYGGGAQPW